MAKKKVLVIEDDSELRELIRIRLEESDFEVIMSSRGDEGVEMAREESPDAIILDVFLPHMDGFTALKEIRYGEKSKGKEPLKDIPVFVMTGRAPMMEEMFRLEGATEFMTKPIDIKSLVQKLEKILKIS
ncbi:MAG TPA: response regulator [Candidatus Omnitrophota bacterium]|nr:response regulator [Candidatus Omnitrophota bacterium]